MRRIVFCAFTLLALNISRAQNRDLPVPDANLQTIPNGSYVIAMDNTNQLNNGSDFNLKSYGLVVHLLNNSIKIKWIITAGKAKDATDISVNAIRFKPTLGTAGTYNFKAGPFVIFAADTSGVAALIDAFNAGITNSNDKIKVYRINADVTADVRYDLTGFVPKAAILDDGSSVAIHVANMTACNITTANYRVTIGTALLTDCYTFASEPHNTSTGDEVDNAIIAIKRFVEFGGNFLAQCHAVETYENNPLGRFQSTTGISVENYNGGTNISYPYPDLSFTQYEGAFSISKGGSVRNWSVNGTLMNNFHKHARANGDTTVVGASAAKLKTGTGGLVFFLGNHRFDDQLTTLTSINGIRMYMNAFLTPVSIANICAIGDSYMHPLQLKIVSFTGTINNSMVSLGWDVYQNENIESFEVQKSKDGLQFSRVTILPGSNKSGKESYTATDEASQGIVYYRLKIKDNKNEVFYSKIILLRQDMKEASFRIAGNVLTDDRLPLEYQGYSYGNSDLLISDMLGRVWFKQSLKSRPGNNSATVLLPATLPEGVYLAEIINGNNRLTAKFIKQ